MVPVIEEVVSPWLQLARRGASSPKMISIKQ
jgi:hypothetical protein